MKHKLEGIGESSAAVLIAALASRPSTIFLTRGIPGKILFFIAKRIFMSLASYGLVILNVGANKLEAILLRSEFDNSFDAAEKILHGIREEGRKLTDEEIKRIDAPVISAFRKFASIGRRVR